jgi:hypothetical protein
VGCADDLSLQCSGDCSRLDLSAILQHGCHVEPGGSAELHHLFRLQVDLFPVSEEIRAQVESAAGCSEPRANPPNLQALRRQRHLWKRLTASPSRAAIQNDPLPRNDYFFERDEREPRSGERPRTVLGFSSFGGSEMPSNTLSVGQPPAA